MSKNFLKLFCGLIAFLWSRSAGNEVYRNYIGTKVPYTKNRYANTVMGKSKGYPYPTSICCSREQELARLLVRVVDLGPVIGGI